MQHLRIVAINACAVVFLLASVEIATRAISWARGNGFFLALHELDPSDNAVASIYRWHPSTGFTLRPNSNIEGGHPNQVRKSFLTVNEYGFLADTQHYSYLKETNEIRIATIGGSTTAMLSLNYEDNWPGMIANTLRATLGRRISLINAGTPGFDTSQSIPNLALRVLPFAPDIVIIYHAYNDLKATRPANGFAPDYSHIHMHPHGAHARPPAWQRLANMSMFYVRARNRNRGAEAQMAKIQANGSRSDIVPVLAIETFRSNLRSMVAMAQASGARVVLVTFATLYGTPERWLSGERPMSDLQRAESAAVLQFVPGLTFRGVMSGLRQFNAAIRDIARERQTLLVDMAKLLPEKEDLFIDRVHFSAQGAKQFATLLAPVVLEAVSEAQHAKN
ncbi:MAG: SGNH/GDSL hydrolase family protein [Pseudomonadota bacterium]